MEIKKLVCEECGSPHIERTPEGFWCSHCGTAYLVEQDGKMHNLETNKKRFCTECGNQIDVNMRFCPKCGSKIEDQQMVLPVEQPDPQPQYQQRNYPPTQKKGKKRTGMKVGMIICLFYAVGSCMAALSVSQPSMISMSVSFLVLAAMFRLLSITPKESEYMSGKWKTLKKKTFVRLSVVLAFMIVFVGVLGMESPKSNNGGEATASQSVNSSVTNKDTGSKASQNGNKQEDKTALNDVEKWYVNQTSAVSKSLIEYSKSIDGLTLLNVDSSKFRFGEDSGWYDCHYTFIFTCKVNGINYRGEARAFMKYQDSSVNWFHFEIFDNTGIQSLVEHYDDSYDQIIEDYYKELESKYGKG